MALVRRYIHKKIVIGFDDRNCSECGKEMVCIGEEFIRSELIIILAQISKIDYYRKKYKCESCEEVISVPT